MLIAAAGALSVATAASVTAAACPGGPTPVTLAAVGPLRLTAADQLAQPVAEAASQPGGATLVLQAYQVRRNETQDAIARGRPTKKHAARHRAPSGSPPRIAAAMLGSFGWSSRQFACLNPLWAHESGWRVTAYNASSGAYGIPQAMPGSRMASAGPDWRANAATQIRWGLRYIKGTYGSPCGAWAHELGTGWYLTGWY